MLIKLMRVVQPHPVSREPRSDAGNETRRSDRSPCKPRVLIAAKPEDLCSSVPLP